MLLILDGLFAHGGKVNEKDFAQRIIYWREVNLNTKYISIISLLTHSIQLIWYMKHGFPELGDIAGLGIGATVNVREKRRYFNKDE